MLTIRRDGRELRVATKAIAAVVNYYGLSEKNIYPLTHADLSSHYDNVLPEVEKFIDTIRRPGEVIAYQGKAPIILQGERMVAEEVFGKKKYHPGFIGGIAIIRVVYLGNDMFAFITSDGETYLAGRKTIRYFR